MPSALILERVVGQAETGFQCMSHSAGPLAGFCLGGCECQRHKGLRGSRGIFPLEILKNQVVEVHFSGIQRFILTFPLRLSGPLRHVSIPSHPPAYSPVVCLITLVMHHAVQLNPDNSNLQGKSKKVRVIGGFELLRVKLVRKLPGGESKKVRVSGWFKLLRVRVIGIQLYMSLYINKY